MQVERGVLVFVQGLSSGERVSNALVTCPEVGDNSGKLELIPHVTVPVRVGAIKGDVSSETHPLWEGPASHQLVGRVTAYQGDDG